MTTEDNLRRFADKAHAIQADVDAAGMGKPLHPDDYAAQIVRDGLQAQRDAVELHKALTEAWRALLAVQKALADETFPDEEALGLAIAGAVEVLDRTSRP